LVKDAKKADINDMKDYAGLRGYEITYTDSSNTNFRIFTEYKSQVTVIGSSAFNNAIGYYLIISVMQAGKDVSLITECNYESQNNSDMSEQFINSLKQRYTVEIY
jgi:hypothetical protein